MTSTNSFSLQYTSTLDLIWTNSVRYQIQISNHEDASTTLDRHEPLWTFVEITCHLVYVLIAVLLQGMTKLWICWTERWTLFQPRTGYRPHSAPRPSELVQHWRVFLLKMHDKHSSLCQGGPLALPNPWSVTFGVSIAEMWSLRKSIMNFTWLHKMPVKKMAVLYILSSGGTSTSKFASLSWPSLTAGPFKAYTPNASASDIIAISLAAYTKTWLDPPRTRDGYRSGTLQRELHLHTHKHTSTAKSSGAW